jgi:hypothetical protein
VAAVVLVKDDIEVSKGFDASSVFIAGLEKRGFGIGLGLIAVRAGGPEMWGASLPGLDVKADRGEVSFEDEDGWAGLVVVVK